MASTNKQALLRALDEELEIGSKVLCSDNGSYYGATVKDKRTTRKSDGSWKYSQYRIHFINWGSRYDTWVDVAQLSNYNKDEDRTVLDALERERAREAATPLVTPKTKTRNAASRGSPSSSVRSSLGGSSKQMFSPSRTSLGTFSSSNVANSDRVLRKRPAAAYSRYSASSSPVAKSAKRTATHESDSEQSVSSRASSLVSVDISDIPVAISRSKNSPAQLDTPTVVDVKTGKVAMGELLNHAKLTSREVRTLRKEHAEAVSSLKRQISTLQRELKQHIKQSADVSKGVTSMRLEVSKLSTILSGLQSVPAGHENGSGEHGGAVVRMEEEETGQYECVLDDATRGVEDLMAHPGLGWPHGVEKRSDTRVVPVELPFDEELGEILEAIDAGKEPENRMTRASENAEGDMFEQDEGGKQRDDINEESDGKLVAFAKKEVEYEDPVCSEESAVTAGGAVGEPAPNETELFKLGNKEELDERLDGERQEGTDL